MLLQHYLIEHRFSSRAHPQSNGMVERRQRMLLNFARLYSDTYYNQNLWHLRLPMCQLIMNSTKSVSRNFTPFFLTYFRHARLPYTMMSTSSKVNLNEDSPVAGQLRMANRVLKLANDEIIKITKQNTDWHNKNSAYSRSFPIGSKLFVMTSYRNNVSFKLSNKWKGPYICLKHLEHNNLLIKAINGRKLEKVHKNLCKPADVRFEHLRLIDTHPLLEAKDQVLPSAPASPPVHDDAVFDDPILPAAGRIEPRDEDPVPPPPDPDHELPPPQPGVEDEEEEAGPEVEDLAGAAAGPAPPPLQGGAAGFQAIDPPARTRADKKKAGITVPNIKYQPRLLETDVRRQRQAGPDKELTAAERHKLRNAKLLKGKK